MFLEHSFWSGKAFKSSWQQGKRKHCNGGVWIENWAILAPKPLESLEDDLGISLCLHLKGHSDWIIRQEHYKSPHIYTHTHTLYLFFHSIFWGRQTGKRETLKPTPCPMWKRGGLPQPQSRAKSSTNWASPVPHPPTFQLMNCSFQRKGWG